MYLATHNDNVSQMINNTVSNTNNIANPSIIVSSYQLKYNIVGSNNLTHYQNIIKSTISLFLSFTTQNMI